MDKHSQKKKGELEKKTVRLFKGETAFIDEMYPRAGHNIIIRNLVHKFVTRLKEKTDQQEIENEFGAGINDSLTITGSGEGKSE